MLVACLILPVNMAAADVAPPETPQVRIDRTEEGLYLSAQVRLELTPVVEDALFKGVPMFFVAEAEVFRSRWYWTDQKIIGTSKSWRLAYQPLTRRWRLNAASGIFEHDFPQFCPFGGSQPGKRNQHQRVIVAGYGCTQLDGFATVNNDRIGSQPQG